MADLKRNIDIGIGSQVAKAGAAKVRAALDSIKRKSRAVANSATKDSQRMARGYSTFLKVFASLGGALAARGIITSTKDFGQAVADLSAITGATGEDLEFLSQKSKEFGETTTLSASQAAEAFRLIASAKPDLLDSVDALSQVTEEAIALAEATGSTLPEAADTLGSSLNQFNSGADQASRFINVLAAGSKFGAAQVGEMAEALKFAGGIASNMAKISFEETNASLQLLSQFAIKGGEAGTQLRMILLSLETQANDKFKPSVVGLQGALDNLAAAQLDSGEAAKLFGSRNVNAANILIAQRAKVEDLTGKLTDSTVAYEQQARRVDTLSGDVKALKSAYEGLELTIGSELNGALRALTQNATENIRALARNPLLKSGTRAILDTIHRAIQDIGLAWDQWSDIVTGSTGGAIVWQSVWQQAIENVVKWTKFLWDQFVIGGPANLKLGITLMIAAFDRLRIAVTEKVRVLTIGMAASFSTVATNIVGTFKQIRPQVELVFTQMAHAIGRTFDTIKVTIASAIDAIVGEVQQKVFDVARTLANMGFEERAREMTDLGIAMGALANNADAARTAALANEVARRAERNSILDVLDAIKQEKEEKVRLAQEAADELIRETLDVAEAQRIASQVAVQGAIAERDATLEAIEALRTKRREIQDGEAAGTEGEGPLAITPTVDTGEAEDSIKELGEKGQIVADGIADGFSEAANTGKLSFADMAKSIIQDLIRIQIRALVVKAITAAIGGFKGGGTFDVGTSPPVPGFATGGEFKVGGQGGSDSQLVAFRASPNETVSVRTPQQQQKAKDAGGGVTIVQNNNIDARGADAERIMQIMPGLLEQNKNETLAEVINLRDKGVLQI